MNLRRLLIHIGRHKSGTSALQRSFVASQGDLAARGILYPKTGRGKDGRAVAHHMIADACRLPNNAPDTFETLRVAFHSEVEPYETVIVSSEQFQNLTRLDGVRAFFGVNLRDVIVVAYLREYLSYVISGFAQRIQNQSKFVTLSDYASGNLNLRKFLAQWADFGDLRIRLYDRSRLENGDIVDDFCTETGLPPLTRPSANDANPSIGGNLLFLKLLANRDGRAFLPYRAQSELALAHPQFRGPFHIAPERAAHLRTATEYNVILRELFGDVPEPSFAAYNLLPDRSRLVEDMEIVRAAGGDVSPSEQVAAALGEAEGWF